MSGMHKVPDYTLSYNEKETEILNKVLTKQIQQHIKRIIEQKTSGACSKISKLA